MPGKAKHLKRSRTAPAAAAQRRTRGSALLPLLLVAAAVCSAIGGTLLWKVWGALPEQQMLRIGWEAREQALRTARPTLAGPAREGLVLSAMSSNFVRTLHEPNEIAAVLQASYADAVTLRQTQVGRLLLGALVLRRMEADGTPVEQRWPNLEPYLAGLEHQSFDHFLPEAVDALGNVLARLGLSPGTARQDALNLVAYEHGPFLQYLIPHLQHLAAQTRAAGNEAAADTCEHLARRLLRDWVVAPGPTGLRLLAADLLAGMLVAPANTVAAPNPPGDPATTEIAQLCRAWREAFRTRAVTLPLPPMPLRLNDEPVAAPASAQLQEHFVLAWWLAAGSAGVAVLAIAAYVLSLTTTNLVKPGWGKIVLAVAPAVGFLIAGWITCRVAPGLVHDELLRGSTAHLRTRLPLVAPVVAGTLAVVGAALLARTVRPGARWRPSLAFVTGLTWLALATLLVPAALAAERDRRAYDAALAAPLEEQTRAIADPSALLAALQAWKP